MKPIPPREYDEPQGSQGDKRVQDTRTMTQNLNGGDCVYARNYSGGPKWLPGQVVQVEGSVLYQVKLDDGRVLRRHIDQLRSCIASSTVTAHISDIELDGGSTDKETVTKDEESPSVLLIDSAGAAELDISEPPPAGPRLEPEVSVPDTGSSPEQSEEFPEPDAGPQPIQVRRSVQAPTSEVWRTCVLVSVVYPYFELV